MVHSLFVVFIIDFVLRIARIVRGRYLGRGWPEFGIGGSTVVHDVFPVHSRR